MPDRSAEHRQDFVKVFEQAGTLKMYGTRAGGVEVVMGNFQVQPLPHCLCLGRIFLCSLGRPQVFEVMTV